MYCIKSIRVWNKTDREGIGNAAVTVVITVVANDAACYQCVMGVVVNLADLVRISTFAFERRLTGRVIATFAVLST